MSRRLAHTPSARFLLLDLLQQSAGAAATSDLCKAFALNTGHDLPYSQAYRIMTAWLNYGVADWDGRRWILRAYSQDKTIIVSGPWIQSDTEYLFGIAKPVVAPGAVEIVFQPDPDTHCDCRELVLVCPYGLIPLTLVAFHERGLVECGGTGVDIREPAGQAPLYDEIVTGLIEMAPLHPVVRAYTQRCGDFWRVVVPHLSRWCDEAVLAVNHIVEQMAMNRLGGSDGMLIPDNRNSSLQPQSADGASMTAIEGGCPIGPMGHVGRVASAGYRRRLSAAQVIELVELRRRGASWGQLAKRYDIGRASVRYHCRRAAN
jgi:hypothetical protein